MKPLPFPHTPAARFAVCLVTRLVIHFAASFAALLVFLAPAAAQPALGAAAQPAQSALQKQHEDELAQAQRALDALQAAGVTETSGAADAGKIADALKQKANALDSLGRHAEALGIFRQAEKLAPDDPSVRMHMAVCLDSNGDHPAARAVFDRIFEQVQDRNAERAATLKKGEKPATTPGDIAWLAVGLALPEHSAINHVFLGNHAKAAAQFTRIYEMHIQGARPGDDSDYAATWRVWLAAKSRAADGMRADTALGRLIPSLRVSTPYHKELLRLWAGKGHWQKILAAIDGMPIPAAEKENLRTEAHFFAAGYYRYVKHDNETALELLDAENARPFNGCVERQLMRREIADLRK